MKIIESTGFAIIVMIVLLSTLSISTCADSSTDWLNKSLISYARSNYEISLLSVEKSLEVDPKNYRASILKGHILSAMGEPMEAMDCYDKAISLDPLKSDAWYSKGVVLDDLGRYNEALNCYNIAVKITPYDQNIWNSMGITLRNLGIYDEAISCYNKSIELSPNTRVTMAAWNNKGLAFSYSDRYEEALDCFNHTLQMKPGDPEYMSLAMMNRGLVLLLLKRSAESITSFEQAIEMGKKSNWVWTAWFGKGVALKSLKRYEEADKAFQEARQLEVNSLKQRYTLQVSQFNGLQD